MSDQPPAPAAAPAAAQVATPETWRLVRRLFAEHGRAHLGAYFFAAVLMAISAAATGLSVSLLRPVVNGMMTFDGVAGGSGFKTLRWLAISVALLYIVRGVATFGQLVVMSRTGNRIVASVQSRVFDRLLTQPVGFFQDRHSSEFMSRLSLAANGVRDTLQVLISAVGRDLLTLFALIVVMFYQDPLMALATLTVLPIAALVLGRVIRRVRKFARRSFDGSTRIMATMQETVQGIRIVKSFGLEGLMRARMDASVRDVERAANRMSAGVALSSPLADTLGGVAVAFVIAYGGWRVTIAHADPGSFFAFVAAMLLAYEPAKRLGKLNLEVQNGLVGARLIYEILDRPAIEQARPDLPALSVGEGRICLEQVAFGYRPDESVLRDLSLTVEPDRMTALVGPSGGGKSTILGLLQRFHEPAAGRITIDGQDIAGVDLASLRAHIAFVSQDVFLFRGTIRENILLGCPGASEEAMLEAARHAHAHDFIMRFALGYDTPVGEQGAQLSGGQRQRIAIARAILKNAPIILLDEPTAALDSESEREVQRALDDLRVGRTAVVVAHRLQTIVAADSICVIENGRCVETGAHAELMARRGSYYNFFAAQFGAAPAAGADLVSPPPDGAAPPRIATAR
ncbi:MAG: ABC transporter ATP-binding protein [Methylobacteriaceae bacterium]|nr:ABC transporter ATP-binding protein [Methylobacteriaceae bacterium]